MKNYWKADGSLTNQEITRLLRNSMYSVVFTRAQCWILSYPELTDTSPVVTPHLFQVYSNDVQFSGMRRRFGK